jgi:ABC-type amino acid transport substrate-binding protein
MTMTARTVAATAVLAPPGPLGSWVEAHAEPSRGGGTYRVLVNHRTGQLIELSEAEAGICQQLDAGRVPDASPATAAFTAELREQGFLATCPPPQARRTVQVSGARLDLRWTGAGRLVTAAYSRGARHLFRPAAVAGQVLLALAGVAAVIAAITSPQHFVLRVRPAQIPLVIGLSLAAVAVHELAHALVVVRHGRAVDAAGVRLHLGTPAFYVESASAVLLTRRERLVQAAAGVWAEWQFTSLIAIWLWLTPLPFAVPLLHRFVILNAATIATNLLPFTGLDGSWLLADAAGVPDLTRRSRGAITRLLTAFTTRQPLTPADKALAAYSAANGLAAAALLATAGFFWYQLFGDLAATLSRHGPAGWTLLIAAAILLGRPAAAATAARLPAAAGTARELAHTLIFRLQWRWRIPATTQLAGMLPALADLSAAQLGILAGQLRRTRHRGRLPATLADSYGIVAAGTITTTASAGPLATLTPGATWNPAHQPRCAMRRAVLIHVDAATLSQLAN